MSAQLTLVNVEKDKLVEKLETMKAEREREHEMMKAEWEREREMIKEEWEREREMMNIELKRSHEALTFEKNRGAFWEHHYVCLKEDFDVDLVNSRNIFLEEEIAKIKRRKGISPLPRTRSRRRRLRQPIDLHTTQAPLRMTLFSNYKAFVYFRFPYAPSHKLRC